MPINDLSTALVLVGVLPAERDLEIARLLGWYRIPLRTAPKIVDVDYIAFYQTAAFGEKHRWRIEQYAEVKGHELTTRAQLLKDEPDHPRANEEYFKVQIGPIAALQTPILAGGWKRITFLYTTGRKLLTANYIKDLAPGSEEREVLWRSLRERALTTGNYRMDDLEKMALDDALKILMGETFGSFKRDEPIQNEFWDEY